MAPDRVERVRARLLDTHRDAIAATIDAAEAVAAGWDGDSTADRAAVVGPLARELDARGLHERFPTIVVAAADAAGLDLPAAPVAAPPYVTVTSLGPVLRATGPDERIAVSVRTFAVERGRPARYRRRDGGPEAALEVRVR